MFGIESFSDNWQLNSFYTWCLTNKNTFAENNAYKNRYFNNILEMLDMVQNLSHHLDYSWAGTST